MKLTINRGEYILKGKFRNDARVWNNFLAAVNKTGLMVLQTAYHQFYPQGFSGVVIIGESHVAIHTFPEHAKAWVEIATCSPDDGFVKEFKRQLAKFWSVNGLELIEG